MLVQIQTNLTPPLAYDTSAPPKGPKGSFLAFLKPSVDVKLPLIEKPAHLAPWGEPTPGLGWLVVGLLGLVLALGAWTLAKFLWR